MLIDIMVKVWWSGSKRVGRKHEARSVVIGACVPVKKKGASEVSKWHVCVIVCGGLSSMLITSHLM